MRGYTMSANKSNMNFIHSKTHRDFELKIQTACVDFFNDPSSQNLSRIFDLKRRITLKILKPNESKIHFYGMCLSLSKLGLRNKIGKLRLKYLKNPTWATKTELSIMLDRYEQKWMEHIIRIQCRPKKHVTFEQRNSIEEQYSQIQYRIQRLQKMYSKIPTWETKLDLIFAVMDQVELSNILKTHGSDKKIQVKTRIPVPEDIRNKINICDKNRNLIKTISIAQSEYNENLTFELQAELDLMYKCIKFSNGTSLKQDLKRFARNMYKLRSRMRYIITELENECLNQHTQKSVLELNRAKNCLNDLMCGKYIPKTVFTFQTPTYYTKVRKITWDLEKIKSWIKEYEKLQAEQSTHDVETMLRHCKKQYDVLIKKRDALHTRIIIPISKEDKLELDHLYKKRYYRKLKIEKWAKRYSIQPDIKFMDMIEWNQNCLKSVTAEVNLILKKYRKAELYEKRDL